MSEDPGEQYRRDPICEIRQSATEVCPMGNFRIFLSLTIRNKLLRETVTPLNIVVSFSSPRMTLADLAMGLVFLVLLGLDSEIEKVRRSIIIGDNLKGTVIMSIKITVNPQVSVMLRQMEAN